MHLTRFYILSFCFQMQKQRREKVNLCLAPRVLVLRTNTCQSTGCKRKSTNIVTFCVINTALLFFPNTFFQACVDFYCLLMVHFSFKQKRPNQNSSEYTCKCKFYPGTLDVIISFSISGHLWCPTWSLQRFRMEKRWILMYVRKKRK